MKPSNYNSKLETAFIAIKQAYESQNEIYLSQIEELRQALMEKDETIHQLQQENIEISNQNASLQEQLAKIKTSTRLTLGGGNDKTYNTDTESIYDTSNQWTTFANQKITVDNVIENWDITINKVLNNKNKNLKQSKLSIQPLKQWVYPNTANAEKEGNSQLCRNKKETNKWQNTKFFEECRNQWDKKSFVRLMTIIKDFNNNEISKAQTYSEIEHLLNVEYSELFEEFNKEFENNYN